MSDGALSRAQGCLLGQCAGDSLGSLVEFQSADAIRRAYPGGVRALADGGTWNTLAGQPTDDSEMALMLARLLAERGEYDSERAREAYVFWLDSGPFDCGATVSRGLRGAPDPHSQANGALMRIAPLGVFGARSGDLPRVAEWARRDAALTHPHPVCRQANALFAMAIATAVRTGSGARELHERIVGWAEDMAAAPLAEAAKGAREAQPADYMRQQGWVLIAFRNALWQLSHAETLEEAVVDTVMRGGDTDTNAAICGALLGAVYGRGAIPDRWAECLLNCRPEAGRPGVHRPRPACFWPVDVPELAEKLLGDVRSCG